MLSRLFCCCFDSKDASSQEQAIAAPLLGSAGPGTESQPQSAIAIAEEAASEVKRDIVSLDPPRTPVVIADTPKTDSRVGTTAPEVVAPDEPALGVPTMSPPPTPDPVVTPTLPGTSPQSAESPAPVEVPLFDVPVSLAAVIADQETKSDVQGKTQSVVTQVVVADTTAASAVATDVAPEASLTLLPVKQPSPAKQAEAAAPCVPQSSDAEPGDSSSKSIEAPGSFAAGSTDRGNSASPDVVGDAAKKKKKKKSGGSKKKKSAA